MCLRHLWRNIAIYSQEYVLCCTNTFIVRYGDVVLTIYF